jgi:hypothetical protein
MAVTFVGAGSLALSATVATISPAAHSDTRVGDILICQLINKSVTANAVTPPAEWQAVIATEINDCTLAADDHQYSLYWFRATTAGAQTYNFTKATDDNLLFAAVISSWRGARSVDSPLDATAAVRTATAAAADNVTFPAYNPTANRVHAIFMAYYGNDLTTFAAAMSSDTNPDCTTRYDLETATGNDCSLACTSGDNDGSNIASRTWASASTADAGSTGVVFALVEDDNPAPYYQPLSTPVRRGGLAAAVLAAGCFLGLEPPSAATPGNDDVHASSINMPVPHHRARLYPALHQPVPVEITGWQPPLSVPTRRILRQQPDSLTYSYYVELPAEPADIRVASAEVLLPYQRSILYPSLQQPYFTPAEELVTIDKWFAPLAEPVRRKVNIASVPASISDPFPQIIIDWHAPLAEPVRRKPSVASIPASVNDPFPRVSIDWHAPLSEPVRRKSSVASIPANINDTFPRTVEEYAWHRPLSEPTRAKVPAPPTEFSWGYLTPADELVTLDKWYVPLGEPMRRKPSVASAPANINDPFPRTVAEYSWYRPLSEPTRRRQPAPPTVFTWGYLTPADEIVTLDKWYAPLARPVIVEHPIQPDGLVSVPFVERTDRVDKWLQSLSEPTRRKVSVANQPSAFWGYFTPAPEVVTVDKWFAPLGTPVKLPAALLVGQHQWLAFISLGEPGPAPARVTTSERDLNLPVTERDNIARGRRENLARGKRQNAAIGRRNNNPSGKRSN